MATVGEVISVPICAVVRVPLISWKLGTTLRIVHCGKVMSIPNISVDDCTTRLPTVKSLFTLRLFMVVVPATLIAFA